MVKSCEAFVCLSICVTLQLKVWIQIFIYNLCPFRLTEALETALKNKRKPLSLVPQSPWTT